MRALPPQQRIEVVDVLRGYALMGLFLVHMVEYFELYWYRPEPGPVSTWVFFLFGGKAYGMFALLFGVSFFIIMQSQARKGVDFGARFVWRLAVLWGFGFVHGLIYGGDILQILAITGLVLVPLYRASNTTLLVISLFFVLQGPSLLMFGYANAVGGIGYNDPVHGSLHSRVFEVYATGSFLDVLRMNLWEGQLAKWVFTIESGRLSTTVGLSLLGFLLARNDFFTDVSRYRTTYLKALAAAAAAEIAFKIWGPVLVESIGGTESRWILDGVLALYKNHMWIAGGLLALIVLYHFTPASKLLRLLAPCGRISLTIYVSQGLVFVPFFYGFGAAAYAWIGQPMSLLLGIVLWCLQVAFAHYWMRNYYYGPFEWLWRAATWLRTDIPFKRRNGETNAVAAVQG